VVSAGVQTRRQDGRPGAVSLLPISCDWQRRERLWLSYAQKKRGLLYRRQEVSTGQDYSRICFSIEAENVRCACKRYIQCGASKVGSFVNRIRAQVMKHSLQQIGNRSLCRWFVKQPLQQICTVFVVDSSVPSNLLIEPSSIESILHAHPLVVLRIRQEHAVGLVDRVISCGLSRVVAAIESWCSSSFLWLW
jgi:hypothetical protein